MQGSSRQAGNMKDSTPSSSGISQQDQQFLFGILGDEKASKTLKTMAVDVLRRNGIPVNINGSNGTDTQEGILSVGQSVVPFGPVPVSNAFQLQMLHCSHFHMPTTADSVRMDQSLPGNNNEFETPSYYPQQPMTNVDSLERYRTLSLDTLFFIFYYNEGTYAQQLAAKVLKENGWMFHTKYLMWFKRVKEADLRTNEFEMGTFSYFDIEQWIERIKPNFVFEFKYLENGYLTSNC